MILWKNIIGITLNEVSMSIPDLLLLVYVFFLATYTGIELISKVPPTLHTPLMSGSNAISGITIVGAILCSGTDQAFGSYSKLLGIGALILATINVVGGYLVTDRMLRMFKKKK
jgi:H+-translocating NAD(P) transhydrogenase subunit alpha